MENWVFFKVVSELLYFHTEFADIGKLKDTSPADLDLLNTPIKTDKRGWHGLFDPVSY